MKERVASLTQTAYRFFGSIRNRQKIAARFTVPHIALNQKLKLQVEGE